MVIQFDHERLAVYQEAIAFVGWWATVSPTCSGPPVVKDQLDRASTSIPLNIAEGNGKSYPRDRCRYLETARGSALESAACLDVLVVRRSLRSEVAEEGKGYLRRIVSKLTGLIGSVTNRVSEAAAEYDLVCSHDGDREPGPPP
jgi:four helix bundle protein